MSGVDGTEDVLACPIRVLVADDHAIVRKGICALLATEEGIEVVGEAADGQRAIEQVERLRPAEVVNRAVPGGDVEDQSGCQLDGCFGYRVHSGVR